MDVENILINDDAEKCPICGAKLATVGDPQSCPNNCLTQEIQ